MAQVYAIGKVTADLKLRQSSRKEPYVCFDITENIGGRDSRRKQTLQIWAFGSDAEQLICDDVQEGNTIWITGNLELEEFTHESGRYRDKRLKVYLKTWGFASDAPKQDFHEVIGKANTCAPIIDGEREPLPE